MEFKLNKNYSELLPKYIAVEILAQEIKCNIEFVEKYFDKIDTFFSNEKEKQIAYKQLGSIVFSCVEALWKSLIFIVNKNCKKRNCNEKCEYRKYDNPENLSCTPPKSVLSHLVNMRLLYVHPFEEVAIQKLQNLRNHIHLTRTLIDGDKSINFNKQFVENMLRLYYVTINQAEMNSWYYDETQPCLKELDGDVYNITDEQQKSAREDYHTIKIILACIDIFHKKPITEKNEYFLQCLSKTKNINIKNFIDEMGQWLYVEGAHSRTEEEYQNALKYFRDNLKPYLPQNSDILSQIDERMHYYYKLYNCD